MNFETILYEKEEDIAIIRMNQPDRMNALNQQVLSEIYQAVFTSETDNSVAGIIITGTGKAFVAGADISEMKNLDYNGGLETAHNGHKVMNLIENLSKPVLAAINGYALGGGCELALACDIRIAAKGALLGQPELNLGIIPGFGGTQRLSRQIGKGNALYLILTAEKIDADRAFQTGLVQEVVDPPELMNRAIEIMKMVTSKSSLSVRLCKKLVNSGFEMDLNSALLMEEEMFGLTFTSDDQKEGMSAFMEKRKANFKKG